MATKLPRDFKEFLKLLDKHGVEYLLVGGYASMRLPTMAILVPPQTWMSGLRCTG